MSSTNERDNGSGSAASARDNAAKSSGKNSDGNDSTVGKNNIKRDAMGTAMRLLTRVTGSDFAAKYGLNAVSYTHLTLPTKG